MTGNPADYVGRRFDLLALPGATASGSALLAQELFGPTNGGQVCCGVQKLAQDWVMEFLSVRGSMKFDPLRGTEFMAMLRTGRLRQESDVLLAFTFAAITIADTLALNIPATAPADERLASAALDSIDLASGRLTLGVTITSVAGDSRQAILPLSVVPVNLAVR